MEIRHWLVQRHSNDDAMPSGMLATPLYVVGEPRRNGFECDVRALSDLFLRLDFGPLMRHGDSRQPFGREIDYQAVLCFTEETKGEAEHLTTREFSFEQVMAFVARAHIGFVIVEETGISFVEPGVANDILYASRPTHGASDWPDPAEVGLTMVNGPSPPGYG